MKILLIGKVGQLGWELQRALGPLGEVTALDYPEINLVDMEPVLERIRTLNPAPEAIINASAYTAVDKAETEADLAWAINATAPGVLAEQARKMGIPFIHFSTDYVFDGTKGSAYIETDPTNPLGEYGRSKLGGEQAVAQAGGAYLIFRTAWVYSTRQGGFVNKVLEWSRQQKVMKVVTDQVSSPTWCRMLAEATAQILAMSRTDPQGWIGERKGLYHLAGSGCASRMEWAQAILQLDPKRQEQVVEQILPALTADFPTPAARPLYSPLNCELFTQTFGLRLPEWREALRLALT